MNERKSIAGIIIPIILIIIFIMCAIVYCIFFMNKQTTNPINNEISNINNSSTKNNNNVTNTVSEFTMTESEFPKVDGATAMLPMIGEITKSVLNYSDEEAQKYLDENTHGKTARACWEEDTDEYKTQKPKNFQMVQVKPNWHDSSDLIGYVSRVSGKAEFVAGEFLKFVAKAWEDTETPYFLCLDEMNLAPVEQYFAE